MISRDGSGTYPAFDARKLATVLAGNRDLMERYKESVKQGCVKAVHSGNRNFTVVADEEMAGLIREAAPELKAFPYDDDSGEVAS